MQDNAVCVYLCSGVCLRAVYQYFVDLRRTRGCGGGGSCLVRELTVSKPGDGKAMVLWNWGSPAPPNLLGLRPPVMG